MDGVLHSKFTSPKQECVLFQSDVGIDYNEEATTSKAQVGARKEFARLSISRQQRETASTEQNKQFDRGRLQGNHNFSEKKNILSHILSVCSWLFFLCFVFFLLLYFFLSAIPQSRYERQ